MVTPWDIAARFGHVNILITRHTSVWLDTDKVWPQTINPKHYLWHSKPSFPTSKKKTKRNFTSHSWNCDDAKGRIQNEWYIGSSSLGFFCHSTDMKTTVCQNGNLFWVQQSKISTWKCPILSVLFFLTANIQISMLLSNLKRRWHQCLYSKLKRKLCHREPAMVNNELFGLFELKISDIFSLYT